MTPPTATAAAPARAPVPTRRQPRRRPQTRRAPATRPVSGTTPIPGAAARTVGVVRDISESPLIDRIIASRAWIPVLGLMLAGIVGLNVVGMTINAKAGQASARVEALNQENSALRAQIAESLSSDRAAESAAAIGMYRPDPAEVTYLRARRGDAARAAQLLGYR